MSERLGTAQWEPQSNVAEKYSFAEGKFWLGRSENATPIGYKDDRHVCLVSGTRGGKGTSVIINNLCFWPGSAVVVDPKGENATVTAPRRGQGSQYCQGMGQTVRVLDPFNAAQVDDSYRGWLNPLDALDPKRDETIDEASRLANAIVVVKDEAADPFWDESARAMLRGLILHVLTAPEFAPDERNLITVRDLVSRGEWRIQKAMQDKGKAPPPPHQVLWQAMECNPAFNGIVAGVGTRFLSMMTTSPKTFEGVLQAVANHTEFLDSPGMRRVLSKSNFKLSELKTRPEGMTLYLSLPQRYMDTHYRWLRMMVVLTTTEMEITRGQPASGHPVLMVLDEFAGLKRMAAIENAVAQIAGFGVKLFFVLQSLEQLKHTYKDNWETFLSNAGLKIFFGVEDHFTREYISKLAGETEVIRELESSNQSESASTSYAQGRSDSETISQSTSQGSSRSDTSGVSYSASDGTSHSVNRSRTEGTNQSRSSTDTHGSSQSYGWVEQGIFKKKMRYTGQGTMGTNGSTSQGTSYGSSSSVSDGYTDGTSRSYTGGSSRSFTEGTSYSETSGRSGTSGTSETRTEGQQRTEGRGRTESIHRRPLIQPDEVGRLFARIDDPSEPGYPGFALVMVTGRNPLVLQRVNYFEDVQFIDCFSPHPDHAFKPPVTKTLRSIRPLIELLEASTKGRKLTITRWFIKEGSVLKPSSAIAEIAGVPPDNRTVRIGTPCMGKVTMTAATPQNKLSSGNYSIPDGPLFTVKTYPGSESGLDPLGQLRQACRDLPKLQAPQAPPKPQPAVTASSSSSKRPLKANLWLRWGGRIIFSVLFAWFVEFGIGKLSSDANTNVPAQAAYSSSTIAATQTIFFWLSLALVLGAFAWQDWRQNRPARKYRRFNP